MAESAALSDTCNSSLWLRVRCLAYSATGRLQLLGNTILELLQKQSDSPEKTDSSLIEQDSEAPKIKGARILLVEDNIINQQVATELLQSAGIRVYIANNGKEAVDKIWEGEGLKTYDLKIAFAILNFSNNINNSHRL